MILRCKSFRPEEADTCFTKILGSLHFPYSASETRDDALLAPIIYMLTLRRHVTSRIARRIITVDSSRNLNATYASHQKWRSFTSSSSDAAKRVKKVKSADLVTQGAIDGPALEPFSKIEPKELPMLKVVQLNITKFPECVLLTKVGNFYEVCARGFSRKTVLLTEM